MTKPLYIGVDGGGTRCRAAALWQGARVDVGGPGANATSDFDSCVSRIKACLVDLQQRAGLDAIKMAEARVFIGQAGVTGPEIAAKIAAALPYDHVAVEEDRPTAVAGALGAADGSLAALGTGSFLARQSDEAVHYQGGYGLRLGDEASGAWLGREMLSLALRAADGWGEQTDLSRGLLSRFGGAAGIIAFGTEASPQTLADLAPEIVEAAEADDSLAAGLMQRGASYVYGGLKALGWQEEPVVLLGGLGPRYAAWLPSEMQSVLTAAKGTSLDGALRLAERMP